MCGKVYFAADDGCKRRLMPEEADLLKHHPLYGELGDASRNAPEGVPLLTAFAHSSVTNSSVSKTPILPPTSKRPKPTLAMGPGARSISPQREDLDSIVVNDRTETDDMDVEERMHEYDHYSLDPGQKKVFRCFTLLLFSEARELI